jgi:hypothetical protein
MVSVSGKIRDKHTKQALGYANVYLSDVGGKPKGGIGTATDVNGNFSLSVPDGSYITVSYVGYPKDTFKVENLTCKRVGSETSCDTIRELDSDKGIELGMVTIEADRPTPRDGNKKMNWTTIGIISLTLLVIVGTGFIIYKSRKK